MNSTDIINAMKTDDVYFKARQQDWTKWARGNAYKKNISFETGYEMAWQRQQKIIDKLSLQNDLLRDELDKSK